ncbi:MAG: hypothetical protein ABSG43_03220 [Solirubrobacteraceae bacterium]
MFLGFKRPSLVALLTAVAVVALPAAASAAILPTLTLSGDTAAGKSPASVGFDIKFNPSGTDSPKDLTISLPPGMLANADLNGGACLAASSPTATCQVGSGTLSAGGVTPTGPNVSMYLVKAPAATDIAGVALVNGTTASGTVLATGAATLTSTTGLQIAFTGLPNMNVDELNFTLTTLRLPSSCSAGTVTVTADSFASSTSQSATATLTPPSTTCASLPYAPTLAATVTKDAKDNGAAIVTAITQLAGESANKSIVLDLPSGIAPNVALTACLNATGCTIGTASAASPLVPAAALANGTVTLNAPTNPLTPQITIAFPAPLALSIVGNVTLAPSLAVSFTSVPDVPLTSLTLNLNSGPGTAKSFTTTCAAANLVGNFTAQSGATKTVTSPITFNSCPTPPVAAGSASGFAAGRAKLTVKVTAGTNAPLVASAAVGLPRGLSFDRNAISSSKKCKGKGKKKKCATTITIKGLTASPGTISGAKVQGGRLVVTFKKAVASTRLTLRAPLVVESKALARSVKKHKVKAVTVTVKVTDAARTSTPLSVKVAV